MQTPKINKKREWGGYYTAMIYAYCYFNKQTVKNSYKIEEVVCGLAGHMVRMDGQ